jgi:hypothetical protein
MSGYICIIRTSSTGELPIIFPFSREIHYGTDYAVKSGIASSAVRFCSMVPIPPHTVYALQINLRGCLKAI